MQGVYGVNKIKIGAVTVLSLASMFQGGIVDTSTNMPTSYYYDSAALLNDNSGIACISSELQNNTTGDIIKENDQIVDMYKRKEKSSVRLHITEIKKHISHFDFEEEYEEI